MKRDPLIHTERTVYGRKAGGKSLFVVIAPHAAGDDLRTGRLARHLAKLLDGAIVLNKRFYKLTNRQAQAKPHFIEDFNELSWSKKNNEWRWFNKKLAMKIFYDDIAGYCDAIALKFNRQPVCIYLHGLKSIELGVDIGMGLKSKNGKNRFVGGAAHGAATGVPTIQIGQLKKMKQLLQEPIKKDYNLDIGVGNIYSAWDKRCGIQFHKCGGRDDYAVQMEIHHRLKESEEDIAKLARLLAETFKSVFKN